eukprot:Amastigsp_a677991_146.p4 type:complete len:115 gc:universal Amastigsp_a677991_146:627-971(+)
MPSIAGTSPSPTTTTITGIGTTFVCGSPFSFSPTTRSWGSVVPQRWSCFSPASPFVRSACKWSKFHSHGVLYTRSKLSHSVPQRKTLFHPPQCGTLSSVTVDAVAADAAADDAA